MKKRIQDRRDATYVFGATVAPDLDVADITHDKVTDMLEDVFVSKALFRDRHVSSDSQKIEAKLNV